MILKLQSKYALISYFLVAAICAGCRNHPDTAYSPDHKFYSPQYAGGFEILGTKNKKSRIIRTKAAWQGADSTARDLLILRGEECIPEGFNGQVIDSAAHRIIAMSSSYIAALDIIGKVRSIVGVSGIDYISNTYIQNEQNNIIDVGNETNVDFEKLVTCSPDIVLLYGINSSSAMEERLRRLKIPYFYMGEYLENNPLGRAEWMVALAEITGNSQVGIDIFNRISHCYDSLKTLVSPEIQRPKIMLNAPYGDNWFMSPTKSSMAALIRDAGGEYVYTENDSNKSVPIDKEAAWSLISNSDIWLNPGQVSSLQELISICPGIENTKCVKTGNVFNCDKRRTRRGGNDFWESGHFRPEVILSDLIKIFHPELSDSTDLYLYRRLPDFETALKD